MNKEYAIFSIDAKLHLWNIEFLDQLTYNLTLLYVIMSQTYLYVQILLGRSCKDNIICWENNHLGNRQEYIQSRVVIILFLPLSSFLPIFFYFSSKAWIQWRLLPWLKPFTLKKKNSWKIFLSLWSAAEMLFRNFHLAPVVSEPGWPPPGSGLEPVSSSTVSRKGEIEC